MKDFNISVKDNRDHKWYAVSEVSFRIWKNHPSDGINQLSVIGNDGVKVLEDVFIEEINFNIW